MLLCLVALLGLCSCGELMNEGEEAPEGMQIASCYGADYRLYVPTSWVLNTSYGISSAYRVLDKQSTVSVNRYAIEDYRAEMEAALTASGADATVMAERIGWFWRTYCLSSVATRALDQEVTMVDEECGAYVLHDANGQKYRYSALVNGETLHFLQVVAERGQAFYVFTFTANKEMFEPYLPDVESMLAAFRFSETPYEPADAAKLLDKGEEAPEGMRPAFGEDVAYCFYVPNHWQINWDQGIYAAYVEEDRTSVSVVPYYPDQAEMRVSEYFEENRKMMENMGGEGGFELIATTEGESLGGRQATLYEYRFRVGGEFYHYRQYVAAYKSMIYSLTYTATEDAYATHLGELDAIVSAFAFR